MFYEEKFRIYFRNYENVVRLCHLIDHVYGDAQVPTNAKDDVEALNLFKHT